MLDLLNELIRKKKSRYTEDYNEMLGDYNRENETIKGYNGRQILELIQNCDDQEANTVVITLDKEANTISIANDGIPFSERGYRSLFIANLSSKTTKRKYIGNKGLGFRSIINWSNTIEIISNGIAIRYSEETRRRNFEGLFAEEVKNKIRSEENHNTNIIPIPFLSIPELSEIAQENFATNIIISYKAGYLNQILEQLRSVKAETLFFLKHIKTIEFHGVEGIESITCNKEIIINDSEKFAPIQSIKTDSNEWLIFGKEAELPEKFQENLQDKEYYEIKMAIDQEFKKSSPYLYSYFPTNIRLSQPYILHATFDLDSTRNQINDSPKNEFLLKEIVKFTVDVAKYFTEGKVSFKPLEILTHNHQSDTLEKLGYYKQVNYFIDNEQIYPCINQMYCRKRDVINISNDFGEILIEIGANYLFGNHILPSNKSYGIQTTRLTNISNVVKLLNNISLLKLTYEQRAKFIYQIYKETLSLKISPVNSLNLLLNDNAELINGSEYIYTPFTNNNGLDIPSFAKIQFINRELYNQLVIVFQLSSSENKSRAIAEKLNNLCNVHSYEPFPLALKIISETKLKIQDEANRGNEINYVREMNRCLFNNFRKLNNNGGQDRLKVIVPSITKNGNIKNIDELVLSKFYPIGEKTEIIFSDIYKDENYICEPYTLGLSETEDISEVERYLIWLGINKFTRYIDESSGSSEYFNYLVSYKQISHYKSYNLKVKDIKEFNLILKDLSINQFIIWIYYDEELKRQMNNKSNSDQISHTYYKSTSTIYDKPSFIKFKILKSYRYKFENFLIDENYSWSNNFSINYSAKEFVDNGITKSHINEILTSLGAKDDFNQLSLSRVSEILDKLVNKFPDGKKSQTLYKKALIYYKEHKNPLNQPVRLFADNGSGLKPYSQNEIYFSEKIKLPKSLRKDFPILNFPSRAGGVNAIKFFRINDLKEVVIQVNNKVELPDISKEFYHYFERIKPLILTLRLSTIEDDVQKKQQTKFCKQINIVLCQEVIYSVKGIEYNLIDYEFITSEDNIFYLQVSGTETLTDLRRDFQFCESIAEIITQSFGINEEKGEFRHIVQSEYDLALKNIISEYGEDFYQEAQNLLGLLDKKQAFWKAILKLKGIEPNKQLDFLTLDELLLSNFNYQFDHNSIDYDNLNKTHELIRIQDLFNALSLDFESFAKEFPYRITLYNFNYDKIKNYILSKKNLIKYSIWRELKNKGIEEQKTYLEKINKLEDYEDFVKQKALKNEYVLNIDSKLIFNEYTNILYPNLELGEPVGLKQIFDQNSKKFCRSDLSEINLDVKLKSLLYFDNAFDYILKELSSRKKEESPVKEVFSDTSSNISLKVSDSSKLRYRYYSYKSNTNIYIHKPKDDGILKEIGNSSESIIYDYMCKNELFSEVDFVSRDNDGLHYDIRYTDKENRIKYVEVKTFNRGYFLLSKDEYEFGKINQIDYEIWLLKEKGEIIQIKDFFTNDKYKPIPNEYIIYLEIVNE